ncbi:MAG TPA: response regulator transcription factor [bacterium]|nr:response regulator transcription factor [bacterium]HPQ65935.1 response regulator transcription factor [bacterium]
MADILLIDDDPHIADVVEYAMREHGFTVRIAGDGDRGLREFTTLRPQLVLLDLKLPGTWGMDLVGRFRELDPGIPIIILTSLGDEVDRVLGLEMGADDYVTKPFSPRELAARARAVLRRSRNHSRLSRRILVGDLEIDSETLVARCRGEEVPLSSLEFRLLETLARFPARVFSRERLIEKIYQDPVAISDRCVDTSVRRIRTKFRAAGSEADPIETVYGEGYRLNRRLELNSPAGGGGGSDEISRKTG